MTLEAVLLRSGRYVVRPAGALGTMGWAPYAWDAIFVRARSPDDAIRRALPRAMRQGFVP